MNRTTAVSWLFKALELEEGEELYLPCERKEDVAKLLTLFRKELEVLKNTSPETEDHILIRPTFKDSSFWVVLLKTVKKEEIAFKKSAGKVVKVIL